MKLFVTILSILMFFGCGSLSHINSSNKNNSLLFDIVMNIFKSTSSNKVNARIIYDRNALKSAIGNIELSDTILIEHASSYFEKTSSIGIYSYSNTSRNSENFKNYFVVKYMNDKKRIIQNGFVTDFLTREKLKQRVNSFFELSKKSFISNLLIDRDIKDIVSDGSLTLQYIFIYKMANSNYSYDVYNLTE